MIKKMKSIQGFLIVGFAVSLGLMGVVRGDVKKSTGQFASFEEVEMAFAAIPQKFPEHPDIEKTLSDMTKKFKSGCVQLFDVIKIYASLPAAVQKEIRGIVGTSLSTLNHILDLAKKYAAQNGIGGDTAPIKHKNKK